MGRLWMMTFHLPVTTPLKIQGPTEEARRTEIPGEGAKPPTREGTEARTEDTGVVRGRRGSVGGSEVGGRDVPLERIGGTVPLATEVDEGDPRNKMLLDLSECIFRT